MSFDISKYKADPNYCVYCNRKDIAVHEHYVMEKDTILVDVSCNICDGKWTEGYILNFVSYDADFVAKTNEELDHEYRIANMTMEEIYGS
jgi:hypothetical protein